MPHAKKKNNMKLPLIINIDSQYDWTSEVQNIWDTIDCKKLHQIFPRIDENDFDFRLNKKLVIIGLCSPSFIDRSYQMRDDCHDLETNTEDWLKREEQHWRKLQVFEERNVRYFNGEEPHFRHPKTCYNYVIEPYGIYSDDCSKFLSGVADMDKLPLGTKGGAGIFLCPERITRIYPTLLEVLSDPKYPLPLIDNPILTNLKMVLIHELGHHIFPVHRNCKGKKYISEGLANYFCYSNLTEIERAWLLYKSKTLQPPEYSSYRFISILHHYYNQKPNIDKDKIKRQIQKLKDKEKESHHAKTLERVLQDFEDHIEHSLILTIDDVFSRAFTGEIDGWNNIFLKETITEEGYIRMWADKLERQTEHLTMAMSLDILPTAGFLDDLDELFANEKKWRWDIDHGMFHMHHRHNKKQINPDFIWDLYNDNSILQWVLSNEIPDEIWSSWGMSTSHNKMGTDSKLPGKLSWPEGPLFRMTTRQDWERIVKESPYQWARNAAMVWLLNDLNSKSDIDNYLSMFTLSDNPPENCGVVIESFDKYSSDFNSSVKDKMIPILESFIEGMEENRSIRIETEKLIKKLKT